MTTRWSFLSPGDLLNPGTEPVSPGCPSLAGGFFTKEPPRTPQEVKWSEVKSLSRVRLFATPWTVAHQAPLPMGFSRQEDWSGLPFPSPGIFPTQGLNHGLPHCRLILYCLNQDGHLQKDNKTKQNKNNKCWWGCREKGILTHQG